MKFTHTSTCPARLITAILMLGTLCAAAEPGARVQAPATPPILTPPAGHSAFAVAAAEGTQGYVCLPTAPGASTVSWVVKGSRPEATLFQSVVGHEFQTMTHFLSPNTHPNEKAPTPLPFGNATWQSTLDTSRIWAQPIPGRSIPAGSDDTCPQAGSIACLLLEVIGSAPGPSGGNLLGKTTFIQRLNTTGGTAPAEGCSTVNDIGAQKLVPYTADYVLFRAEKTGGR